MGGGGNNYTAKRTTLVFVFKKKEAFIIICPPLSKRTLKTVDRLAVYTFLLLCLLPFYVDATRSKTADKMKRREREKGIKITQKTVNHASFLLTLLMSYLLYVQGCMYSVREPHQHPHRQTRVRQPLNFFILFYFFFTTLESPFFFSLKFIPLHSFL